MTSESQNTTPLQPELVAAPQHWRLALCVSDDTLQVAATSEVEDNSLIWCTIGLDKSASSPLRALETAIYDNPLLLADFGRVDILVDTPRLLLIPAADMAEDAEVARKRLEALYLDTNFNVYTTDVGETVFATAIPADSAGFIQRTFPQAGVSHRLAVLAKYYGLQRNTGNNGKFNAHLREGAVDIVAYSRDSLLLANTFATPTVEDVLFYILSAASWLEFDDAADRMLISGDTGRRDTLLPLLRQRGMNAMPAIFPTALFRMGKGAMQAPLELLALSFL